jgi:hypothetical protein
MTKRNKATSEEELEDAIQRMKKHPESRHEARNSQAWEDYLSENLGFTPESVKAQNFWEDVRQGVRGKTSRPLPTQHDLALAGVKSDFVNDKTKQKSYRGANGRWVKVVRYGKNGNVL